MTKLEYKLIEIGTALERSLGHEFAKCPKVSPAVPCTCGQREQLLAAVRDWDWVLEVRDGKSPRTKFLLDGKPAVFAVSELIGLGNALARSAGHHMGCPRLSSAIPCICGEGNRQAQALADWDALMLAVKEA